MLHGEPDAGNLHVRFEEGRVDRPSLGRPLSYSTGFPPGGHCLRHRHEGLTSGAIPLGAMIAREDLGEAFYGPQEADIQFAHGHTFAGNPLAIAVGIAVLDEIVEKDLCRKVREIGDYLASRLEGLRKFGVIRGIRGKGLLRGVELVQDVATKKPFPRDRKLGAALRKTSLRNGLIMRVDADWFAMAPALIAERSDIDEMYALVEKSLGDALDLVRMT